MPRPPHPPLPPAEKAEGSGDIATPLAAGAITRPVHVRGTLGALLCGALDMTPASPAQDITLFKSVGVAFQVSSRC